MFICHVSVFPGAADKATSRWTQVLPCSPGYLVVRTLSLEPDSLVSALALPLSTSAGPCLRTSVHPSPTPTPTRVVKLVAQTTVVCIYMPGRHQPADRFPAHSPSPVVIPRWTQPTLNKREIYCLFWARSYAPSDGCEKRGFCSHCDRAAH